MKEYKVVRFDSYSSGDSELEAMLNRYARQGWKLVQGYFQSASYLLILERDV